MVESFYYNNDSTKKDNFDNLELLLQAKLLSCLRISYPIALKGVFNNEVLEKTLSGKLGCLKEFALLANFGSQLLEQLLIAIGHN